MRLIFASCQTDRSSLTRRALAASLLKDLGLSVVSPCGHHRFAPVGICPQAEPMRPLAHHRKRHELCTQPVCYNGIPAF